MWDVVESNGEYGVRRDGEIKWLRTPQKSVGRTVATDVSLTALAYLDVYVNHANYAYPLYKFLQTHGDARAVSFLPPPAPMRTPFEPTTKLKLQIKPSETSIHLDDPITVKCPLNETIECSAPAVNNVYPVAWTSHDAVTLAKDEAALARSIFCAACTNGKVQVFSGDHCVFEKACSLKDLPPLPLAISFEHIRGKRGILLKTDKYKGGEFKGAYPNYVAEGALFYATA